MNVTIHYAAGTSSRALRSASNNASRPILMLRMRQRFAQQMVKLARAQSGLANSLLAHQLHHRLGLARTLVVPLQALVIRLPAQPHVVASPDDVQPSDEALRKDLPKGFFTTRTP